jgi:fatty-acyl-CoA synthase
MGRTSAVDCREESDAQLTREELLQFFEGRVAKWWIPDDVVFVAELAACHDRQAPQDQAAGRVGSCKLPTA